MPTTTSSESHSRHSRNRGRSKSARSNSRSVSRSSSYRSSRSSRRSCESSNFSYERSRDLSSSYSRSRSYSKSSASNYSSDNSRSYRRDRRSSYRKSTERGGYKDSGSHTNKRIVVIGITRNVNKAHLREIFGAFGSIMEAFIPPSRNGFSLDGNPLNRSIAYIEFNNRESADEAIIAMNGGMIDGSEVRVEFATDDRSRIPPKRRNADDYMAGRIGEQRNGRNTREDLSRVGRYNREGYGPYQRGGSGRRNGSIERGSHGYSSSKGDDRYRSSRRYASP